MKCCGKKHGPHLRIHFLGIKVVRLPPEQITARGQGDTTWTASKLTEVVVLYAYNGSAVSNQTVTQFGEPLTAPFGREGRSSNHSREWDACELWKYDFAGNAFALNTLDGDPLIVTCIINAASEELHNAEGKENEDEKGS